MSRSRSTVAAAAFVLLMAAPAAAAAASLDAGGGKTTTRRSWTADHITVSQVWTRMPVNKNGNAEIHLRIANHSDRATMLIIVDSPVADRVTMQVTEPRDVASLDVGLSNVQSISALNIPGGETRTFPPSGKHVAMIGLHHTYHAGDTIPLELTFLDGQQITVAVRVRGKAASSAGATPPARRGTAGS